MPLLSYFYLLALLDLYLLFPRISSQETVQQALWNVPNGQEPDFSNTFTGGNTIPISWNQYGNGSMEGYDALDLWVTTFDYSVHQYSQLLDGMFFPVRFVSWVKSNHKLAENLSLDQGGSWTWTINIPASQLQVDAKYVLRFKPINSPRSYYNLSSSEVSSPGILILQANSSVSSSSSTTLTSSTTSPASAAGTSPSVSNTSPATPGSHILSTAAKAGIGIGVSAAVLLSLGGFFAYFLLRRRRRVPQLQGADEKLTASEPSQQLDGHRVEVNADQALRSPAELPGDPHIRY